MTEKSASMAGRVRLAPGCRLLKEPDGEGRRLTGPAGVVQLNETAAAILELCDGSLTRDQIIVRVLPASGDEGLAADTRDFLAAALRRGWLVSE